MLAISKTTRTLLDRLREHRNQTRGVLSESQVDDVVRRLGEAGEPAAIPSLVADVFWVSRITAAATEAVAALLPRVAIDDLQWLDHEVRAAWPNSFPNGATVDDALRAAGRHRATILALLSFHPNGYVREEVVERLARSREGWELPYLLVRLNDWVPQVRQRARTAVLDRVRDKYASEFARSFSLLTRLALARRTDSSDVLERVSRLLLTASGRSAMLTVIRQGTRTTARAAVRFLIDHAADDLAPVIDAGLAHEDQVIRAWVARVVARALPTGDAQATLRKLVMDASPAVRRESLLGLAKSFPQEASQALHRAVLDRSGSVRDAARYFLKDVDFRAIYRNAIEAANAPRPLASAIAGLTEVGETPDARIAVPHLSHSSSIVRRAALRCVMRCNGDAFSERIAEMLQDPSRAVSAAARNALRAHARNLGLARLENLFTASVAQHARVNALHLMAALPKWQSIIGLLRAAAVDDENVASLARKYVHQWNRQFNRSQTSPSPREIDEMTAAFATASAVLDQRTVQEIRFAMATLQRV